MTDEWNVDLWETINSCPVCGNQGYVPASGNKKSDILLVGEFPGDEEIKKGIPMIGPMGRVLRTELGVLGIDIRNLRKMNVWFHPKNDNKDCFEYGVQEVIKEAKNKRVILLMGDEVVKYFTGKSVSKVCGLQVQSDYLSCPHIFACINPAQVFQRGHGVGEIRLALQKFVREINNE